MAAFMKKWSSTCGNKQTPYILKVRRFPCFVSHLEGYLIVLWLQRDRSVVISVPTLVAGVDCGHAFWKYCPKNVFI